MKVSLTGFIIFVFIALFVVGGVSEGLTNFFGFKQVKTGVPFMLMLLFLTLTGLLMIVIQGFKLDGTAFRLVILVGAAIVALYIYVPKLVPSIFSVAVEQIKSVLPLG